MYFQLLFLLSLFGKQMFTYFNMFTFYKVYVGSIIPWSSLQDVTTEITVWKLVVCALLILLLRRLPIVLALMKFIPAIKTYREGKILCVIIRYV
jgi:NhaP-type Na+/H+ or K+/H+ antiporter